MNDDATTDAVYDIAAQAARWRERAERAEARLAEAVELLRGLMKGCDVYESASDTDEGYTFYDGRRWAVRRFLASVSSDTEDK